MKNSKKNLIKNIKVAIVSDEMQYWGGSQDIILALQKVFPHSTIYTSIYEKHIVEKYFPEKEVRASFVQRMPFEKKLREIYFSLYPLAFKLFNFRKYDLVISISSAFSKFVRTPGKTKHFLYCMTPPRYLWMQTRSGRGHGSLAYKVYSFFQPVLHAVWRRWDRNSARFADMIAGNSKEVGRRIETFYGLNPKVLYPPVDIEYINLNSDYESREDWFLYLGRVEKYKGVDLMVRSCIKAQEKLKIAGDGAYLKKLKKLVEDLNAQDLVEFVGFVDQEQKAELLYKCKALIFPVKDEDFGIVPIEANAAGCPVLAFAGGGVLETILDGITGKFFHEYTVESLKEELMKWNEYRFDAKACREQAESFSFDAFEKKLVYLIHEIVGDVE
jgi:glycosyltransferase involved in cell wall biosynthesis